MGKIAFLFSGQGAQTPGMGMKLREKSDAAAKVFAMAEAIRPGTIAQCAGEITGALSITENVQPCLFCTDLAAAEALRARGAIPDMAAGFSLGEIPALAFCGIMRPEDAFRLVCARAKAMQACADASQGGMAAILGLDDVIVEDICEATGVYPVNYNCPGQLVIAGESDRLAEATAQLKQAGGRVMPLRVSGAFHTPLMADTEAALRACLAQMELSTPTIPLWSNTQALPYSAPYADLIARQAISPVRFRQTLERMAEAGATTFIEVGVGRTLCGLVRKTLPDALALHVEDAESLENALLALAEDKQTC